MIFRSLHAKLDAIMHLLGVLLQKEKRMSIALDNLREAVARDTSVTQSALTFIQGIAKQLADLAAVVANPEDSAAIQALADEVNANSASLANATVANTSTSEPALAEPNPVSEG